MVYYGQVVIGPPGCGKTTYCVGMCDFLRQINRPTYVVNFDPANETSLVAAYGTADGERGDTVIFDVMEDVISLR